jgi:hypothetical protein
VRPRGIEFEIAVAPRKKNKKELRKLLRFAESRRWENSLAFKFPFSASLVGALVAAGIPFHVLLDQCSALLLWRLIPYSKPFAGKTMKN